MEFRPRNYDYHRRKPDFYQTVKRQRRIMIGAIIAALIIVTLAVYFLIIRGAHGSLHGG